MKEAVIVSTARTPIGKAYRGGLNDTPGATLGGHAIEHALKRSGLDGGEIEVVSAGDGHIHYRFREYHGYTRLMWWDFIGGIEGVLSNLGAEDMTARVIAGGEDGDAHMEVVLRWRDR